MLIISCLSVKGEFSEITIIISRKDYSYKEKATLSKGEGNYHKRNRKGFFVSDDPGHPYR